MIEESLESLTRDIWDWESKAVEFYERCQKAIKRLEEMLQEIREMPPDRRSVEAGCIKRAIAKRISTKTKEAILQRMQQDASLVKRVGTWLLQKSALLPKGKLITASLERDIQEIGITFLAIQLIKLFGTMDIKLEAVQAFFYTSWRIFKNWGLLKEDEIDSESLYDVTAAIANILGSMEEERQNENLHTGALSSIFPEFERRLSRRLRYLLIDKPWMEQKRKAELTDDLTDPSLELEWVVSRAGISQELLLYYEKNYRQDKAENYRKIAQYVLEFKEIPDDETAQDLGFSARTVDRWKKDHRSEPLRSLLKALL